MQINKIYDYSIWITMADIKKVKNFISSQQSIQFYQKAKDAFLEVLLKMPEEHFDIVSENMIIMALHEWVLGQMMHFPNIDEWCKIMQLTIPRDMPFDALKYVIAHEFWHAMQWRNWREWDNDFESGPNEFAQNLWFPRTPEIASYINNYWRDPE
ncbi:MAG: hypothetical protein ACD_3C00001G0017 [uncultured bacterium (gcode 4)]|uniref:Uncharacterized protein n=1 Tax=uncultured bacterium (gcode 4) TaxID=1234023 RepID=K2FCQ2_9BACT|nr:MAG: hypothetical protein ACD_3C00001G0017 [uncultured bacterium (gcode 4)]